MLKYLRYIFRVVPRIVFDLLFYLNRYARHPEKYPLEVRYKRVRDLVCYVMARMRMDIKQKGLEDFRNRKGSFLLVSNHLSDMDPLIIIYMSEKPISFIAKKEVYKFPVIGKCVRAIDGIFMDRADLRQSAVCLKQCADRLKVGDLSYCIFPEGTRNKDPKAPLLEFHAGSFKPANWAKVNVVPMAQYGTFRVLAKKPNPKRIPISISVLPEQGFEAGSTQLAATCSKLIQDEVNLQIAYDEAFFKEGKEKASLRKLPKPYIHG